MDNIYIFSIIIFFKYKLKIFILTDIKDDKNYNIILMMFGQCLFVPRA